MKIKVSSDLAVKEDVVGEDEDAEAGVEQDEHVLEAGAGEVEAGQPVEAEVASEEDTVAGPAASTLHPRATPRVRSGDTARHLG